MTASVIESSAPFQGLEDKLSLIRRFYAESLQHPVVRKFAERSSMDGAGRPSVEVLFVALKSHFRYVPDSVGVELIKAPWDMVRDIERQGWFAGDCDDASSLAFGVLRSVGIESELAVAWYGDNPNPTHIFVVFPLGDGSRVPFDLCAPQLGVTKTGIAKVAYAS